WRSEDRALLLDVREPMELAVENVPDAVNIPLGELRGRLGELPRDRDIHVVCRSGQRAYYSTRLLLQHVCCYHPRKIHRVFGATKLGCITE
ncbi:rhodanese-like domain-containing protein, partial [Rhizobium johnstonii]|uniref:rhodanese-like domain-containing protein n=1 Tax=Rhizobium johnstonii TaxID=3019933 RepID=UPI003F94C4E9